ncbi:coiled-coil domain-containing protein 9B isoform X2 [Pseudophryne corroboree]|uniref:coiled-coil domain-containing protein 9B isoform X2 n=1 Tax=Pseudophryne corroboree TaxID=495146 RepID=UPI0030815552
MAGRNSSCVESEYFSMGDDKQKQASLSVGEIRKKEQKDAELDKKIQALRKKNEAILRRHQEIEEDRRNAEKEIIAVTSQRPKQDILTITITKSPNEKRIVSKSRRVCDGENEQKSTMVKEKEMLKADSMNIKIEDKKLASKPEQESVSLRSKVSNTPMKDIDTLFTFGRGWRRQILIDMEKEKRIVRKVTDPECSSLREKVASMSMEDIDDLYTFGRGRRRQILVEMEKEAAKRKVERKLVKVDPEKSSTIEQNKKVSSSEEQMINLPSEQMVYLQWKKERDLIDLERLARHKNSNGEWRRPWDFEKTEDMFEDSDDTVPSRSCSRRGSGKQIRNENTQKVMQTISSKAKGRDRLTGRAQRWNSVEDGDFHLSVDFPMLEGLDYRETTRHSQGSSNFLKTEDPKCSVQIRSLENEDKFGLLEPERVLLKNKQDVPFYEKEMEEACNVLPSADTEIVEYLSVLHYDREPGDNTS